MTLSLWVYEWFEKFEDKLLSRETFFSSLTSTKISGKKYEHFLKVWHKFEMKAMKDYHDLYLKCDVFLLSDVFEKFRSNNWKNYGLCQGHYLRAPDLSWDDILNMTKVELELIPDPDMFMFFEKGMRGGVSYISNSIAKSATRYLKSYDPKKQSKHIIHLDANNLNSHVMPTFLSYKRIQRFRLE